MTLKTRFAVVLLVLAGASLVAFMIASIQQRPPVVSIHQLQISPDAYDHHEIQVKGCEVVVHIYEPGNTAPHTTYYRLYERSGTNGDFVRLGGDIEETQFSETEQCGDLTGVWDANHRQLLISS